MDTPCRRIDPSSLDLNDDHQLFCDVFDHVASQLGEDRRSPESGAASNLPPLLFWPAFA